MILFLINKDVIVVMNGFMYIEVLVENNICVYLLGGMMKSRMKVLIGVMV